VSDFEFDDADRLAVGAFGEPGQRVFVLQVEQEGRVLTVKVEKGQVAELATHLTEAMADRPPVELGPSTAARIDAPAEPAWVVGSIRLGYDTAAEQMTLMLEEFPAAADEDSDEAEPSTARITITAEQALALATEIADLVAAGRPPCPHCGYPLDPAGHVCPKSNGHRPPKL
jgi:uncharacterized repeat protein (TIGR03847 family)